MEEVTPLFPQLGGAQGRALCAGRGGGLAGGQWTSPMAVGDGDDPQCPHPAAAAQWNGGIWGFLFSFFFWIFFLLRKQQLQQQQRARKQRNQTFRWRSYFGYCFSYHSIQQRLVTERRAGTGRKSIYALGLDGGVGEGGDVLFSGFLGCFLGVLGAFFFFWLMLEK